MKDDTISRQAAIDAFIRKTRPHDNGDGTITINIMSEGLIREVLTDLPAAEPRRGKWILKPNIYGVAYCSECDYELHTNDTNYCPNCGASMKEESDGKRCD